MGELGLDKDARDERKSADGFAPGFGRLVAHVEEREAAKGQPTSARDSPSSEVQGTETHPSSESVRISRSSELPVVVAAEKG